MQHALKVVTLNTWKCDGRYWDRLDWMAKELERLSPDIVFLQEAFTCPACSADTADWLASALGLEAHPLTGREKERMFEGAPRWSSSDLAILCPFTPLRRREVTLTGHEADPDRKALALDVECHGLPLRLVNTHLTHTRDPEGQRARHQQAKQVFDLASPLGAEFSIVGGDFNANLNTPELDIFSHSSTDRRRVHPPIDDPKGTMQGERFDPDRIPARIDHLFVFKNLSSKADVTFNREAVVMDSPVGPRGEFPSDHAAVVAELSVDTRTPDP